MSIKQDRTSVRTASELERKYNFGKSFAEAEKIATDARDTADEAIDAVDRLDGSLDQEGVFNRLTNNGTKAGIFVEDGVIYINASYIKSGEINADLLKVGTITSKDGNVSISLESGIAEFFNGIITNGITVRGSNTGTVDLLTIRTPIGDTPQKPVLFIRAYSAEGKEIASLTEVFVDDESVGPSCFLESSDGSAYLNVYVTNRGPAILFKRDGTAKTMAHFDENGLLNMNPEAINGMPVRWIYSDVVGHYILVSDNA